VVSRWIKILYEELEAAVITNVVILTYHIFFTCSFSSFLKHVTK